MSSRPVRVDVYKQDVKVKRDYDKFPKVNEKEGVNRGEIQQFSKASERRLLFICRNSGHLIRSQIALTYHFNIPEDGKTVKKQLERLIKKLKREYGLVYYLWVLEFQERGAPHIHFFSSLPNDNIICRKIGEWWNKITKESETHLRWQTDQRAMIEWKMVSGKYLSGQYLSKQKQKQVPENFKNVGRFWGASLAMSPECERLWINEKHEENNIDKGAISTVRKITRRYEKELKKYGCKRRFRDSGKSYSLPSKSAVFRRLLDEEITQCGTYNVQIETKVKQRMP